MNAAIQITPMTSSDSINGQPVAAILAMNVLPQPAQRPIQQALATFETPPRLTRHLAQIENLIAFSGDIREWGINE